MAEFNFDEIIDRRGTGALKYDVLQERYGSSDLLPLWVADMDFATPHFIIDALEQRLKHPVLGYTITPDEYWQTLTDWLRNQHGWEVKREWLSYIPGIVKGIGMVLNVFTKPGDKVIIQPPVYHPFRLTPLGNKREVVYNPLIEEAGGTYRMDFEGLERLIDDRCKVLILSNPHNPAGIMWDEAQLKELAAICHRHHIIVISDEIHCDMPLFGHRHIPFATVSPEAAACSITFGAPSKTFNIAGVVSSYSIVPNPELRTPFYHWLEANEFGDAPIFSVIATIAAFQKGDAWRRAMLKYIEGNVEMVENFFATHLPQIKPWRPEASFLIWLDCRDLHLSQPELNRLFVEKARLALNDGEMFGREGVGFMRLNVASPRSVIEGALQSLLKAYQSL